MSEIVKHTPGPWHYQIKVEAGHYILMAPHNRWVIAFRQNDEFTEPKQRANADRIIECVNAFEGIDRPQEFMDVVRHLSLDAYSHIASQRDRLMEALQALEDMPNLSASPEKLQARIKAWRKATELFNEVKKELNQSCKDGDNG